MKIELKDILHLYLGQEVQTTARKESSKGIPMGYKSGRMLELDVRCQTASVDIDDVPIDFKFNEIKPILRSLSDMTDEEFREVVLLHWGDRNIIEHMIFEVKRQKPFKQDAKFGTSIPYSGFDRYGNHKIAATFSSNSINAQQFLYLIKQGFDIFDLIETEQSINQSKYELT